MEFKQTPFLKPYIPSNTKLWKQAEKKQQNLKKQKAKLRNNVIFGKLRENLMSKFDVRIITNRKNYSKWSTRPTFRREKQLVNGLIIIEKDKWRIKCNKTTYTGDSISKLSKVLKYDFHYNYDINKHGEKPKLLFTDTDSLMHETEAKNVYKGKKIFAFSRYLKDSKYYEKKNSLIFGKVEDVMCCMNEKVFVGLKAIIYTYITEGEHECKIAKGVKISVVEDVVIWIEP